MAYLNFFRDSQVKDPSFFDEGPRIVATVSTTSTNTSSIDTSAIDAYRQGVELTQIKHFDAGIVKIHAGEPGHQLRRNRFGMDRNFRNDQRFEELDYFNPATFLKTQELLEPLLYNIITFPIITSDNDQIENYIFDGVMEPLTIRSRASFFSIDIPFEAHEVKGAVMGGNTDQSLGSDVIVTVRNNTSTRSNVPFLDMIDMMGSIPMNGYFMYSKSVIAPFVDVRYSRNVITSSNYDTSMIGAVSLMSGSTDNYIGINKVSSTTGWDYDSNVMIGTDSLAFGGMGY